MDLWLILLLIAVAAIVCFTLFMTGPLIIMAFVMLHEKVEDKKSEWREIINAVKEGSGTHGKKRK